MPGADETLARRTRRLLAERGLRPKKSRGQSFLIDASIARRIADFVCEQDAPRVLEIGSGLGALTEPLANCCERLVALEIEESFASILQELFADRARVRVVCADALRTDLSALCEHDPSVWRVAGNLPYYAATAIILRLLDRWPGFERLVVMVQREVGERLLASPGNDAYGSLSVIARYYLGEATVVARVPRGAFTPQPKVDSTVLILRPRAMRPVSETDEPMLFALIRAGFGQRRKRLANALAAGLGGSTDRAVVGGLLRDAAFDGNVRAEELALDDFIRLARVFVESGVRLDASR
jgi:16S rRNA (adenine1518-N6/adenine1519-N6)-dimethyltransferase